MYVQPQPLLVPHINDTRARIFAAGHAPHTPSAWLGWPGRWAAKGTRRGPGIPMIQGRLGALPTCDCVNFLSWAAAYSTSHPDLCIHNEAVICTAHVHVLYMQNVTCQICGAQLASPFPVRRIICGVKRRRDKCLFPKQSDPDRNPHRAPQTNRTPARPSWCICPRKRQQLPNTQIVNVPSSEITLWQA